MVKKFGNQRFRPAQKSPPPPGDCRTCDNAGTVRVAPPQYTRGQAAQQKYQSPRDEKCPDCSR